MKNCVLIVVIQLAVFLLVACNPADNRLSSSEKKEGWVLLFDGKTMNGWRDYQGKDVQGFWKVEDGLLASMGQGSDSTGYLISDAQYENFILTFDWKIEEGGNSGVFYHVVERPLFKAPYLTGPEYQVIDNLGFPQKLEEWQQVGADYGMHPPVKINNIVKKAGKWNSSKIIFDNGHVEHWLNGAKVVEFEAWSDDWFERKEKGGKVTAPEYGLARYGHFAIQNSPARVCYKNVMLKELPGKPGNEVLFNGKDLTGWTIYGKELWYVEDGELVCESGPEKKYDGYLATKKYYKDFDLTLDFKQIANGNSGVFIRSVISEGDKIAKSGWQVEVAPPGLHSGGIYETGGRKWLIKPDEEKEKVLKMREWNSMRIIAEGNKVTTWLNGTQMIELDDDQIGRGQGRIILQIHGGGGVKVKWKNLVIKEL
jgi:hypothetical protein